MSMDEYLLEIKETIDILKDIGVFFLKPIMVWYMISNLLLDYDITKQMILGNNKLPTYSTLLMYLLNEELSKHIQKLIYKETKALLFY